MNIEELKTIKTYSREELREAAVILHPKHIEKYGVTPPDVGMIFEQGSNFTRLRNPIIDEKGNKYYDSEAFYMAQRFADPVIRKMIALCSTQNNFSKKVAYLLKDQMEIDMEKRMQYMRRALREKFLNNPALKRTLLKTGDRDIIELTYWDDSIFGISHETLTGSNILGKLLVETRILVAKCM